MMKLRIFHFVVASGKSLSYVFLTAMILMSFQNCGQGFKATTISLSQSSTGVIVPVCVSGTIQSGFLMGSVVYPMTCAAASRTCLNGQWSSSTEIQTTCKQQCLHPATSTPVDSGTPYISYKTNQGATQVACDAATNKITSICSGTTGLFSPPPAVNQSCLVQGQTCAYTTGAGNATPSGNAVDSTVTGYVSSSAVGPTTCVQATRSCQASGQWTGTVPLYTSCAQKCVDPDTVQPVNANSPFSYWTLSMGTVAQCSAALVTSICQTNTGLFSPPIPVTSARFKTCMAITAPVISSFVATPETVIANGISTLSWTVDGATSLSLTPSATPNVTGKAQAALAIPQTTTFTLTATNAAGSTSKTVTVTVGALPLGRAIYDSVCANCHQPFATSTLASRHPTAAQINNAFTIIPAMNYLNGTFTTAQIDSLVNLFASSTSTTPPIILTSQFSCAGGNSENITSKSFTKLTGEELTNTYKSALPASIWSGLSSFLFYLPTTSVANLENTRGSAYTAVEVENLNKFNEQAASLIVNDNAAISSLIGSCASKTTFAKTCFDTFVSSKLNRILRNSISTIDSQNIYTLVSQGSDVPEQLKILIEIVLSDIRFVYHLEQGDGTGASNIGLLALSSYEVANRISYGMTASPPDDAIWADAVANKLKLIDNVQTHVDRLSTSSLFKLQVGNFFKYYLTKGVFSEPPSNATFLQGLSTTGVKAAADAEFNDFVNYQIFTQKGNLNTLLTSKVAFPSTSALAAIYGTPVTTSAVAVSSVNYPGLFSRVLLNLGTYPNTNYLHRGISLRENVLCTPIGAPPDGATAQSPTLTENDLMNLTRREYTDRRTLVGSTCLNCHSKINQLGYLTGSYDNIGRYITQERTFDSNSLVVATHPVNVSASPMITIDDNRPFNGVENLQKEFVTNNAFHQCLTIKMVQYFNRAKTDFSLDSCMMNKIDNRIKSGEPMINVLLEKFKSNSILYKITQ